MIVAIRLRSSLIGKTSTLFFARFVKLNIFERYKGCAHSIFFLHASTLFSVSFLFIFSAFFLAQLTTATARTKKAKMLFALAIDVACVASGLFAIGPCHLWLSSWVTIRAENFIEQSVIFTVFIFSVRRAITRSDSHFHTPSGCGPTNGATPFIGHDAWFQTQIVDTRY